VATVSVAVVELVDPNRSVTTARTCKPLSIVDALTICIVVEVAPETVDHEVPPSVLFSHR
jgi:hypothetical protein